MEEVLARLVLGSEGVVEGGDVMVVVVLVVGGCIEEGIFINVLLGSGGWRGVMVFFSRKDGLGGVVMCIFWWIWVVYIYICLTLREY